jgi:hypothetical protein
MTVERVKVIACEVMKEELSSLTGGGDVDFEFVPQGLHLHPEKLNVELQRLLDETEGYSRVILAFGLCGGGAKNLKAGGFTLSIPRVHDCITLLLGARETYDKVRKEEPGTLYLSVGWVKGEAPVISEYGRTVERYGKEKATKLLKRLYNSYKRVLFISTLPGETEEHIERSREAADVLGLVHEEMSGELGYMRRILTGPWDSEDFITIPPYGTIDELRFLEGEPPVSS